MASWQTISFRLRDVLRDPDDAHVLELAFAAGVPVVTHNVRNFRESASWGVEIYTPGQILRDLRR